MDFERARSKEQKNIRIKQITASARKLFETQKYEEITLAGIAKELSFTRANLYKYVATKEEIFLLILIEDISSWIEDIKKRFLGKENISTEEFAKAWAEVLDSNREMIKVLSLMYSIIEKNVTVDKLVSFKLEFFREFQKVLDLIQTLLPDIPQEKAYKFIQMQMYFVIGLYPATRENKIQKQAIEKAGIPYIVPDLVSTITDFILILINSIKN